MGADLSSRELRRSVRRHLESMGNSPGEVAGRLAGEGVRGVPAEVSECVLARYLHAVIGSEMSVRRVVVKERSVRVFRAGYRLPVFVAIPIPVSKFIRAFDAGCYPQLVDGMGMLGRVPTRLPFGEMTGSSGTGSGLLT